MNPQDAKTFDDLKDVFIAHDITDREVHGKMIQFIEDAQPMLDAFKKNKIKRMVWEEETDTLYIYAKKWGAIALALTTLWAFIKYFIYNFFIK